jgi:NAD(P)-dependent dehydrogenase (short-subunit alcohol dehydrogenase family)
MAARLAAAQATAKEATMEEKREPATQFVDAFATDDVEALKMVVALDGRNLSGHVAIVTGGGRGIGRLVAEALAGAGAAVAVTARSEDQLDETVASITSKGGTAIALPGDVSDADSVTEAVHQVQRQLGPVDLLINNAGISGPFGPAWEVDAGEWWRTFGVNLQGVFLFAHAVLPGMVTRRSGRIINVSSNAGAFRWPLASAYAVSKAAVIKFTENLARETKNYGVKVFAIHPGLLPIGMTTAALESTFPSESAEGRLSSWARQRIDEGHGATPESAVELVLLLCSGAADALSGCYLTVHDDLWAIVSQAQEVRANDLYTLQVRRPARVAANDPVPLPS